MRVTEVMARLERLGSPKNVGTISDGDAEACRIAAEIIEDSIDGALLRPKSQIEVRVAPTFLDRSDVGFCTREHDCHSTVEPCNGLPR